MGGWGSSRWQDHTKAKAVEDCLVLDIAFFVKGGHVRRGAFLPFRVVRWTFGSGEERASLGVDVDTRDPDDGVVHLRYTANGRPMDYRLSLEETPQPFGGTRWWWKCPGAECGRRVAKLYLPPNVPMFACRRCHGLTYTSAQEHDRRVGEILRGRGDWFGRLMSGTPSASALRLALKAHDVETKRMKRWSR